MKKSKYNTRFVKTYTALAFLSLLSYYKTTLKLWARLCLLDFISPTFLVIGQDQAITLMAVFLTITGHRLSTLSHLIIQHKHFNETQMIYVN